MHGDDRSHFHLQLTPMTPMPTAYELMEAYRAWWRGSYSTSPNSQAVILAAAWAEHVLSTYRAGEEATPPPGAP